MSAFPAAGSTPTAQDWQEAFKAGADDYIHGLIGDGVTDDTAALQASLAAVPPGGTWRLPTGRFLIRGSGAQIFLRTTSIHIQGSLHGTVLVLGPTTGASTDIFRFSPEGVGLSQANDYSIQGVGFSRTSTASVGRHLINIDVSAVGGRYIDGLKIMGCYLGTSSFGGPPTNGNTINLTPYPGSTQSAIFRTYIQENTIVGSVNLDGAGDSIFIKGNIIANVGAITVSQVPGAGQFVFENNNVSVNGGLVIRRAVNPIIRANEFEQQATTTNPRGAMIDLLGDVGRIDCALIEGNLFQSNPGLGAGGAAAPTFIRIGAGSNVIVTSNRFGQSGGARVPEIVIDASAVSALIKGDNRFFSQSGFTTAPLLSDATTTTTIGQLDSSKANVASPVFTGSVTAQNSGPLQWNTINTAASTGNRAHGTYYDGATCSFLVATDNFSATNSWLTMTRSGQTIAGVSVRGPFNFGINFLASDPSSINIPVGQSAVYKNTTSGAVRLWVNDAGTLKSVALS